MKDYTYLVLVIKALNYDDLIVAVPNGKDVVVEGICVGVDDEPVGKDGVEVGVDDEPVGKDGIEDGVDDEPVGKDGIEDGVDDEPVGKDDVEGIVEDLGVVDFVETLFPEVSIDDRMGLLFGIPILYPINTRIIGIINKR